VVEMNEGIKLIIGILATALSSAGMVLLVNIFLKYVPDLINDFFTLLFGLMFILIGTIISNWVKKGEV